MKNDLFPKDFIEIPLELLMPSRSFIDTLICAIVYSYNHVLDMPYCHTEEEIAKRIGVSFASCRRDCARLIKRGVLVKKKHYKYNLLWLKKEVIHPNRKISFKDSVLSDKKLTHKQKIIYSYIIGKNRRTTYNEVQETLGFSNVTYDIEELIRMKYLTRA